jgi:hypothetical protein
LTKERERPDKAEKTRIIQSNTAYRKGCSASPIRKEPIEKLTAIKVVTANINMALTA